MLYDVQRDLLAIAKVLVYRYLTTLLNKRSEVAKLLRICSQHSVTERYTLLQFANCPIYLHYWLAVWLSGTRWLRST